MPTKQKLCLSVHRFDAYLRAEKSQKVVYHFGVGTRVQLESYRPNVFPEPKTNSVVTRVAIRQVPAVWLENMRSHYHLSNETAPYRAVPVGYMVYKHDLGNFRVYALRYEPKAWIMRTSDHSTNPINLPYFLEAIVIDNLKGDGARYVTTSRTPSLDRAKQLNRIHLHPWTLVPIDIWISALRKGAKDRMEVGRR
jgi:hypothetical protein